MITDEMTNTVYFSQYMASYTCFQQMDEAMTARGINHHLLKNTRDIWARDFMPIQLSDNHFVAYNYSPDYLDDKPRYVTTYSDCMPFQPSKLECIDLRVDGGNVIKCGNCVMMTIKVLKENPDKRHFHTLLELEEALQTEVVLIPWDTDEPYGHADGMVRYLGADRVLINNYCDVAPNFGKALKGFLNNRFEVEELHFGKDNQSELTWAYLNYLRVGNCLFIPQLGLKTDELACRQLQELMPETEVIPIDAKGLAKQGGALNCISWNVKLYG
jgi:agmatine/peptidylarginine deiminase